MESQRGNKCPTEQQHLPSIYCSTAGWTSFPTAFEGAAESHLHCTHPQLSLVPELLDAHLQILLLKWLRGTARWQSHTSKGNATNTRALTARLERASDSQVCDFMCDLSDVLKNNKIYQGLLKKWSLSPVSGCCPAVTVSWFWASLAHQWPQPADVLPSSASWADTSAVCKAVPDTG